MLVLPSTIDGIVADQKVDPVSFATNDALADQCASVLVLQEHLLERISFDDCAGSLPLALRSLADSKGPFNSLNSCLLGVLSAF